MANQDWRRCSGTVAAAGREQRNNRDGEKTTRKRTAHLTSIGYLPDLSHALARRLASNNSLPHKRQRRQHMPADAVGKKPQALTRAILAAADADMVESAETQLVDREAAAADVAGNFAKGVKHRLAPVADAEDADAIRGWRMHQADGSLTAGRLGHAAVTWRCPE